MKNAHGLVAAKDRIEAVQNAFFKEVFTVEENGVTMSMNGRYELKSVVSASAIGPIQIVNFHKAIYEVVKTKEMAGYCKVRNEIRAKYRIDIAKSIPEVAEAVRYMDSRRAATVL